MVRGRCHASRFTRRGREMCGARGEHHLLIDDESVTWACDEHLSLAVRKLHPIDHHPTTGALCSLATSVEPRLRWHLSTLEHVGFCYLDDGPLDEMLGLVDLARDWSHDRVF